VEYMNERMNEAVCLIGDVTSLVFAFIRVLRDGSLASPA
jgi:hypothetical protein